MGGGWPIEACCGDGGLVVSNVITGLGLFEQCLYFYSVVLKPKAEISVKC